MKKIFYSLLSLVTFAVFATSCDKNDDVTTYYDLSVSVVLPEDVSTDDITSGSVVVVNQQTGRQYSSEEIQSAYSFELPGGTYTVTASFHNTNVGTELSYSASKSVSVYEAVEVSLELEKSVSSGLIFKEVYYNMVKPNGKTPYMRDQFMEIYNNSDEVQYLDNCVIGILEGSQAKLPSAWIYKDGKLENQLMKEYALDKYTIAFIGSGTTHPLEPGKSVVIACQAQNHIEETEKMYDSSVDGAMVSPVDLSHADYEVNLINYKPNFAVNNDRVPDMPIIYAAGTQNFWGLPITGNAIILAKLPADISPIDYAKDDNNFKERPDGAYSGTKYLMIPQEYVLDGLNIVNNSDKPDQRVIRLRPEVDAGMVYCEAPYKGKSIRRKVDRVENGRTIFKDTNNSTEDFLRDQVPTPGIIPTVAD